METPWSHDRGELLGTLDKKAGYQVHNSNYLRVAFRHRSSTFANPYQEFPLNSKHVARDYQRLEFVGDSVLQLLATEWLFEEYPMEQEGFLTKKRQMFVREEACVQYAKILNLKDYVVGGSQLTVTDRVLADVFEALLAAIFLDTGGCLESPRKLFQYVLGLCQPQIEKDDRQRQELKSKPPFSAEIYEERQLEGLTISPKHRPSVFVPEIAPPPSTSTSTAAQPKIGYEQFPETPPTKTIAPSFHGPPTFGFSTPTTPLGPFAKGISYSEPSTEALPKPIVSSAFTQHPHPIKTTRPAPSGPTAEMGSALKSTSPIVFPLSRSAQRPPPSPSPALPKPLQQVKLKFDPNSPNPKSDLINACRSVGVLPEFKDRKIGPDHQPQFEAAIYVLGMCIGEGRAPRKASAEAHACRMALAGMGCYK